MGRPPDLVKARSGPSIARTREEQGRLFWVWLLTLPILLLIGASRVFGAPWPNPLTQRIALVALAYPVVFVVGEPLFVAAIAAIRERRANVALIVAGTAAASYAVGVLALFTSAPPAAGLSALIVSVYLTVRYATRRY